jgi:hypothetical protein
MEWTSPGKTRQGALPYEQESLENQMVSHLQKF